MVCRKYNSLKERVNVFWPHLLVSIIFIFVIFVAMGVLGYFQYMLTRDYSSQQATLRPIFIVGWVLLGISLIIWIVKIFRNFLITK